MTGISRPVMYWLAWGLLFACGSTPSAPDGNEEDSAIVLSWNRDGGFAGFCDELKISSRRRPRRHVPNVRREDAEAIERRSRPSQRLEEEAWNRQPHVGRSGISGLDDAEGHARGEGTRSAVRRRAAADLRLGATGLHRDDWLTVARGRATVSPGVTRVLPRRSRRSRPASTRCSRTRTNRRPPRACSSAPNRSRRTGSCSSEARGRRSASRHPRRSR